MKLSDEQIKHMVERFLRWRLPEAFNPDGGISFQPMFNEHTAHPMKAEPTGTSLFDYGQATEMVRFMVEGMPTAEGLGEAGCHGLDTPDRVSFYEQDFYVLSNFSSFRIRWKGRSFDTSEAAYHWEKFPDRADIQFNIEAADSAHEAFKLAERLARFRRSDWDDVKVDIMREILRAKVDQHEYVRRKLLATGDRELVENSWRDDFWGWGPKRDGKNMLGILWMEIRAELRDQP